MEVGASRTRGRTGGGERYGILAGGTGRGAQSVVRGQVEDAERGLDKCIRIEKAGFLR